MPEDKDKCCKSKHWTSKRVLKMEAFKSSPKACLLHWQEEKIVREIGKLLPYGTIKAGLPAARSGRKGLSYSSKSPYPTKREYRIYPIPNPKLRNHLHSPTNHIHNAFIYIPNKTHCM